MFRGDLEAMVLGVLQAGEAHGYEIAKRLQSIGGDLLKVGEARLYPCLHTLEQEGNVASRWVEQEGKPNRKVYSLTDKGRGALHEKRKLWTRLSGAIDQVLSLKPAKGGSDV